jgi:hypothetical protein
MGLPNGRNAVSDRIRAPTKKLPYFLNLPAAIDESPIRTWR